MTAPSTDKREGLSPIKRALLEIRELRARVADFETAAIEPIAVVGMGCRLPGGVRDEATLWRVLAEGTDTICDVPAERWDAQALYDPDPDHPGTICTRAGGFLDDVAGFDAAFFGIAPREAASMDPQQRLTLEVAWASLEDAGIAPDSLSGTATGVFIGVGNSDYARMLYVARDHIDAYAGSGGSLSVVAGRLAYALGLQGPALAVDTACSASLVAVHLACQSLRRRECDLALTGGVNLILSPDAHIAFTKARMMAPDGRCKTFDAAADGYGRGEGCAVVVLRRLSDAREHGERVLALIRGSAVNQDGRSGGLTAPNGPAQAAVIRAALADAKLEAAQIDYVEAHGTGTSLGDPIELQALAAALGEKRASDRPLIVGSCKTNFGHLEAAAGIAGMLKVIAALRRRRIPPHLHFKTPNPLIDWAAMPLRVPTALQEWPVTEGPARAGVSSFGFSGTNAHVILEESIETIDAGAVSGADRPLHVLALSTREHKSLHELARRYRGRLAEAPDAADIAFSANTGRALLAHRLSVRGATAGDFDEGLAAFLAGLPHPAVVASAHDAQPPVVGFLFTGQGAQYHGMARYLDEAAPAFRSGLDECAAVLDLLLERPLRELLYGANVEGSRIDDTGQAQPALFAIEYALAKLWRSWGIAPAVVLGHSLGEYAAACVAGVLPLADALRVVVERGRLMASLPGEGAMVAVFAPESMVLSQMAGVDSTLAIAAVNGPEHVVISGASAPVAALVERLARQGIRTRPLRVSHGFHSPLVEPALEPFARVLASVRFGSARCAVVSNLTGLLAAPDELAQPAYWLRQMRQPVRFAEAVRTALAQGVTHFIEIGPHPVLLGMTAECVTPGSPIAWLPSLRRAAPDWTDIVDSLQRLYAAGARVNWRGFDQGHARRRIAVPATPFNHRRHWIDWAAPTDASAADDSRHCWASVAAALERESHRGPVGVDVSGYAAKWACLERLTVAHAATVLRGAGLFVRAAERASAAQVRERLGASDSYRYLLQRWLQRLARSGALRIEGEAFVSDVPLADPDLDACVAESRAALADNPALLAYIEHCGRLLPAVMGGHESPLETLFPDGSFDLAEGLYERSAQMLYINGLAASSVEALVAARGARATLKVLEIGGGTGGTSSSLIPLLPVERTDYLFTDVTPVFLDRARAKFASYPCVRFGEFDLERDAAAQGLAAGSFNLIVAANAVHATRNLRESLRSIRSLLAPGGLLLLVETTEHLAWFDMTTGLIEGWQNFADDLRSDNPLLPPDTWLAALHDAGFDEAGAWPAGGSAAADMGQHVVVAWVAGQSGVAALARNAAETAMPGTLGATPEAPSAALPERLRVAVPDEQLELLRDFVRGAIMQVLRLPSSDAPGRDARLMDLGMDSLMAVQMRNLLGTGLALERRLPATLMFDHPTIDELARFLQRQIAAPAVSPGKSESAKPTPASAVQVAAMSEDEVEALLLKRLGDS